MSNPICKHCGREMSQHRNITSTVMGPMRVCGVFEAKPEPVKAKPGVLYRHPETISLGVGLVSGRLAVRSSAAVMVFMDMDSQWTEVPE